MSMTVLSSIENPGMKTDYYAFGGIGSMTQCHCVVDKEFMSDLLHYTKAG